MSVPSLPPRYAHRALVGQGGMGQVHRVWDDQRACDVALKLFSPADSADREQALFLFKQEFWASTSLRHPNLVTGFDYGTLPDGTPYMTMEWVPGHDLAESTGPRDVAAVLAWLPGVAAALGYLHGQRLVHGDLKPENIRLGDDGQVKLMDLGLLTRTGSTGGPIRGSLATMAPEVIRQAAVDGRADLYALGAVVYGQLAGRPLFEADSTLGQLRSHLDAMPLPLQELNSEVPPDFAGVIMRLLAKDPAARYPDAAALLKALGRDATAAPVGLLASPLMGRESEQAALREVLDGSADPMTALVGPSGAGKTRLLNELRAEAQLAGRDVLTAQGVGRDAAPYQALKPWLAALAAAPSPARDRLAPVLVALLPTLDTMPAPALEGAAGRLRLHLAIAELAREAAPAALWLLDDADQLDPASTELLGFLQQQGAGLGWDWVLAGDHVPVGGRTISLAPLDATATRAVAAALLGQSELPAGLSVSLPELSGGRPGTIEAILGHWLSSGALKRTADGWQAADDAAFDLPGGLTVLLDERMLALSDDAQQLARHAAVLGEGADLGWLEATVALPEARFFAALGELRQAGILDSGGDRLRFVRPGQMLIWAASWPAEQREAAHGRAADSLAKKLAGNADDPASPLADVLGVATHALAGPDPLSATPWVLAGARRAMALFVLDPAERLLRRALAVCPADAPVRLDLEVLLANVLRFHSRPDEALALYQSADLLARLEARRDPQLASELVSFGILHALKAGYAEALLAYQRAIALADAQSLEAAGIRARLAAARVSFFAGNPAASLEHLQTALAAARGGLHPTLLAGTLSFYGYILASTDPSRGAEGLALLDEAIALNQALGDLVETNEALDLQGNLHLSAGRYPQARSAFEAILANCDRLGMGLDAVTARLNLGAVLLELGDLDTAQTLAQAAAQLAEAHARKFPQAFALALEGFARVHQGELALGSELLQKGLALARAIENRYLELNVLGYWIEALLFLGRLEAAGDAIAEARRLARETHIEELDLKLDRHDVALAVLRASLGEPTPTERAEVGDRVARLVSASQAKADPVTLAHALRWRAAWLFRQEPANGEAMLLDETLALATAAGLERLQAELIWLRAGVALAADDLTAAEADLRQAHAMAEGQGFHPLAQLTAHALAVATGDGRGRRDAARAFGRFVTDLPPADQAAFFAAPERSAIQDAGSAVVEDGLSFEVKELLGLIAAINDQRELGDVLELALKGLVDIADAERGFLLLFDGVEVTHQVFIGMSESESDGFSSSLAYQALWSGEPVFVEDALADAHLGQAHSVQALALRSVLAVPLLVGGRAIGTMLADSQRITQGFGPVQLELAMALASQVAGAITQARIHDAERVALAQFELLHRLAMATLGVSDLTRLMAPFAAAAIALTGAQQAYLLLGDDLTCEAAFAADGRELPRDSRGLSQSVCRWVAERGEPLYLADAQEAEEFYSQKSVMALGLRTIYAVPVRHADRAFGVLYLQNQAIGTEVPSALSTLERIGAMIGAFLNARQTG